MGNPLAQRGAARALGPGQGVRIDREEVIRLAPATVCTDDPCAGVNERGHAAIAIHDSEIDRPDAIRGRIDCTPIAELRDVVGLARLKLQDVWLPRTMEHDLLVVTEIAQELP